MHISRLIVVGSEAKEEAASGTPQIQDSHV